MNRHPNCADQSWAEAIVADLQAQIDELGERLDVFSRAPRPASPLRPGSVDTAAGQVGDHDG